MNHQVKLAIVGAQKAGTTSLKNYLGQHPDILTHFTVEFSHFIVDEEFERGFPSAVETFFDSKDIDKSRDQHIMIKSALMSDREPSIARLKEHNPDVRLVFMIRDPTERAYSSFLFEKMYGGMQGKTIQDIRQDIKDHSSSMYRLLIRLGLYADHIECLLRHFDRRQIKVITFEEFKKRPLEICRDIFEFCELPDFRPQVSSVHNKTTKIRSERYANVLASLTRPNNIVRRIAKSAIPYPLFTRIKHKLHRLNRSKETFEPLDDETRAFLDDFFAPYNARLAELGVELNQTPVAAAAR